MTNKKRKGFTIVELVIVIAVIAILAGVLIPTFASIIDKANQSSDIQAVRQMNVLLKAESVENEPTGIGDVINIVGEAGYTDTKLTPKSKDHGFYWHSGTNTIVLVKDPANEPAELIYPQDNQVLTTEFETLKASWTTTGHAGFYDLADSTGTPATPDGIAITDMSELIAALENENGGNYYLDPEDDEGNQLDEIALTEYVTVSASAEVTIDLNGHTLTVADSTPADAGGDYVITILSSLTITDTGSNRGSVIFENPTDNEEAYYMCSGITVGDSNASLTLKNINIVGKRVNNIENYGTATIENTNFTVNGGTGFYNEGSATIEGGSFIVAGGVDYLVSNCGIMTIEGTIFKENTEVEEEIYYYNNVPIYNSTPYGGGTSQLTLSNSENTELENTELRITDITADYVVQASGGKVIIEGGKYNGSLLCLTTDTITITGGQFYIEKEIDGVVHGAYEDFSNLDASKIAEFCNNSSNIIVEHVKDENNNSITTCTISYDPIPFDATPINAGDNVSMYIGTSGGIELKNSISVKGTLKIYNKVDDSKGDINKFLLVQSLAKLSTDGDGEVITNAETINEYLKNAINGVLSDNGSSLNIKLVDFADVDSAGPEKSTTVTNDGTTTTISLGSDLTLWDIMISGKIEIDLKDNTLNLIDEQTVGVGLKFSNNSSLSVMNGNAYIKIINAAGIELGWHPSNNYNSGTEAALAFKAVKIIVESSNSENRFIRVMNQATVVLDSCEITKPEGNGNSPIIETLGSGTLSHPDCNMGDTIIKP